MKHCILNCDNQKQDQWSALYIKMACILTDRYGLDGKRVVREGVRQFARRMAEERRQALISAGCKTNLETFFADGFGLSCGDRTRKEWIRHTEQELFVTICTCPYAQAWSEHKEIGRMFCEEYYPALVHAGTSEKAQINLGYTMLNGRDNTCRLSIYLRPANVPAPQRAQCFPSFDLTETEIKPTPGYKPDFDQQKKWLYEIFYSITKEWLGDKCAMDIQMAAKQYAEAEGDTAFAQILEE